jgi:hypothetical protein
MPVDLQALTTIQQNNFTPQSPPARGPITLMVCVTPHLSTTSRQHYFHRTAPLYMERRIFSQPSKTPPGGRRARIWGCLSPQRNRGMGATRWDFSRCLYNLAVTGWSFRGKVPG